MGGSSRVGRAQLLVAVGAVALLFALPFLPGCERARLGERVRGDFDALAARLRVTLGKGFDTTNPTVAMDSPMAYAFLGSAFATASSLPGAGEYLSDAVACGMWLCENRDADKDGFIGWGLPVRVTLDDGHDYPENQEYTVTTALAVNSLLDTVRRIDESEDVRFAEARTEFLTTAKRALLDILDARCYTVYPDRGTAFWYSCDAYGATYEAPNVIALLAGGLQRLSSYVEPGLAERCRGAAAAAVRFLVDWVNVPNTSVWTWDYQVDRFNRHYRQDLVHAAFTAWGLLSYLDGGGTIVDQAKMTRVVDSFKLHDVREEDRRYIARYPEGAEGSEEAKLWDLGMALAVAARVKRDSTVTRWLYTEMLLLRNADGTFRFADTDAATYVRAEATALLGLAEYCRALIRTG